jgi:hypothetical protein
MSSDDFVSAISKENNKYLVNKNSRDIRNEIVESLKMTGLDDKDKDVYSDKLVGYRFVDEIDSLHVGKFTRWIKKFEDKLTNGGFLTVVDYTDNGILLTIKMWRGTFAKILFDECLLYQKLSDGEQLILMVSDYVHN